MEEKGEKGREESHIPARKPLFISFLFEPHELGKIRGKKGEKNTKTKKGGKGKGAAAPQHLIRILI